MSLDSYYIIDLWEQLAIYEHPKKTLKISVDASFGFLFQRINQRSPSCLEL